MIDDRDLAGVAWRTSSICGSASCVQVAPIEGGVAVRDSKDPANGIHVFDTLEWSAFVAGVKAGEFDFFSE